MEIWKPIPGYEGYYEASSEGRIRSVDRLQVTHTGKHRFIRGKVLKLNHSQEYLSVELNADGKHKSYSVHRLIAAAFLPNPENKPTVNHIDGNKLNNCVANLEWATWSENNLHAFRTGLNNTDPNKSGATKRSNEVTSRPVYCIETDTVYVSRSECARQLGIHSSAIVDSIQGHRKIKSKGKQYTFKDINT